MDPPSPLLGTPRAQWGQAPAQVQGFRPRELVIPLKHSAVDFYNPTRGVSSAVLSLLAHAEYRQAPGQSRRTLASTGGRRPQGQLQPVSLCSGRNWTRLTLLWLLIRLDEGTYAAYPTVLQMLIDFCKWLLVRTGTCLNRLLRACLNRIIMYIIWKI